jgi:ribonuclease-3
VQRLIVASADDPRKADYQQVLQSIAAALGHTFADVDLLVDALTHSSFRNEKPAIVRSDNERLEFLGDAVLQWVVSALIWRIYPNATAGEMTRRRADLVCEQGLARVARTIGLGEGLRLGKGEERSGGRLKPRLLSSALEAAVAAVYLDSGTEAAMSVCQNLFAPLISDDAPGARDFKTRLQEYLQSRGQRPPTYETADARGPAHARSYRVLLKVEEEVLGEGEGRSKLEAEQCAAELALRALELRELSAASGSAATADPETDATG